MNEPCCIYLCCISSICHRRLVSNCITLCLLASNWLSHPEALPADLIIGKRKRPWYLLHQTFSFPLSLSLLGHDLAEAVFSRPSSQQPFSYSFSSCQVLEATLFVPSDQAEVTASCSFLHYLPLTHNFVNNPFFTFLLFLF